MSKKNFIIHDSTIVQIDLLNDEELGRLFRAMTKYHLTGEELSKDDRLLYSIFVVWKKMYDGDKARYEAVCKRNQINGSKSSGAPVGNRNAKKNELSLFDEENNPKQPKTTQNNPKQPDNDNEYDNDNDNDNESINEDIKKKINKEKTSDEALGESKKKSSRFVKPTIEELQAYITEKGYHFTAENFYSFYESKGWMIGKNHMKDWKAACRTWDIKRKQETIIKDQDEEVSELPAGLTEEKWRTYVGWFKKNYPRICSKIQPLGFLKMMSYVHMKSLVLVKILNEIEKSDFDGDIVSEVYRISGEEPYKSEIM